MSDIPFEKPSSKKFLYLFSIGGMFLIALLTLFFSRYDILSKQSPQFGIQSHVRPCSPILIAAENSKARQKKPLIVKFDGYVLPEIQCKPKCNPPQWEFQPCSLETADTFKIEGWHTVYVKFKGDDFVRLSDVMINDKAPYVSCTTKVTSNVANISGIAAVAVQLPGESLFVDLVLASSKNSVISLPVDIYKDPQTGISFFKFKTKIDGLPQFDKNDPVYNEPFAKIQVRDGAGNSYFNIESYAKFISPGAHQFGVNNIADITVFNQIEKKSNSSQLTVLIAPKKATPLTVLPNGNIALPLHVDVISQDRRQLTWANLPLPYGNSTAATNVLRDDHNVALSFNTTLVDTIDPSAKEPVYRVEQTDANGTVYASKPVKAHVIAPKHTDAKNAKSKDKKQYIISTSPQGALIRGINEDSLALAQRNYGAQDYINKSENLGLTPCKISVPTKVNLIHLSKIGYEDTTMSLTVLNVSNENNIVLRLQDTTIFFTSIPPVADIYMDDSLIGKTNIKRYHVKTGFHAMRFIKGDVSYEQKMEFHPGTNPSKIILLNSRNQNQKNDTGKTNDEKQMADSATIFISTLPPITEVYMDGTLIGKSNINKLNVKSGKHKMKFVKGKISSEIDMTFTPGNNSPKFINLTAH